MFVLRDKHTGKGGESMTVTSHYRMCHIIVKWLHRCDDGKLFDGQSNEWFKRSGFIVSRYFMWLIHWRISKKVLKLITISFQDGFYERKV